MKKITRTPQEWKEVKKARKEKEQELINRTVVIKDGNTYYFDVMDKKNEPLVSVAVKTDTRTFYSIFDDELAGESADAYAFLRENVIGKLSKSTTYLLRSGYVSSKENDQLTKKETETKISEICDNLGKKPIDAYEQELINQSKEDMKLFLDASKECYESIKTEDSQMLYEAAKEASDNLVLGYTIK